ncbi:hypothetical protein FLX56_15140 [Synechococcus moorigangaii CMS01]|nr:hypothetical protein [Synechococcus moorigangaii CMS01]
MSFSDEFKQALRSGDLSTAFTMVASKAMALNITTRIVRQPDQGEAYDPSASLHTQVDLLNGTIENNVGETLMNTEHYQNLQQFHQQQVALGNRKIQENFQGLQQLFQLLVTLQQYDRLLNAETPLDLKFLEIPNQTLATPTVKIIEPFPEAPEPQTPPSTTVASPKPPLPVAAPSVEPGEPKSADPAESLNFLDDFAAIALDEPPMVGATSPETLAIEAWETPVETTTKGDRPEAYIPSLADFEAESDPFDDAPDAFPGAIADLDGLLDTPETTTEAPTLETSDLDTVDDETLFAFLNRDWQDNPTVMAVTSLDEPETEHLPLPPLPEDWLEQDAAADTGTTVEFPASGTDSDGSMFGELPEDELSEAVLGKSPGIDEAESDNFSLEAFPEDALSDFPSDNFPDIDETESEDFSLGEFPEDELDDDLAFSALPGVSGTESDEFPLGELPEDDALGDIALDELPDAASDFSLEALSADDLNEALIEEDQLNVDFDWQEDTEGTLENTDTTETVDELANVDLDSLLDGDSLFTDDADATDSMTDLGDLAALDLDFSTDQEPDNRLGPLTALDEGADFAGEFDLDDDELMALGELEDMDADALAFGTDLALGDDLDLSLESEAAIAFDADPDVALSFDPSDATVFQLDDLGTEFDLTALDPEAIALDSEAEVTPEISFDPTDDTVFQDLDLDQLPDLTTDSLDDLENFDFALNADDDPELQADESPQEQGLDTFGDLDLDDFDPSILPPEAMDLWAADNETDLPPLDNVSGDLNGQTPNDEDALMDDSWLEDLDLSGELEADLGIPLDDDGAEASSPGVTDAADWERLATEAEGSEEDDWDMLAALPDNGTNDAAIAPLGDLDLDDAFANLGDLDDFGDLDLDDETILLFEEEA